MPIWQLCANLLIPNCLRSNLSYSPLAALVLYVNKANSQFCVLRNIVFCAKKHSFVRENKHRLITITITVLFSEGRKRCKEILYIIYINIYIIYNFNSYFFSARVMERNLKLLLLLLSIAVSRHSSAGVSEDDNNNNNSFVFRKMRGCI